MTKKTHITTICILLVTLLSLFPGISHAQRYPIQVNTMISPPYSLKLSDYVESGYDRIQVTVNPLDVNLTAYQVKLKLVIESFDGSIRIESSPGFVPPPVFLSGGVPEMLTSYDVSSHFNLNNLTFRGFSKNQYIAEGHLPEGYYRIGFQAVDYNRATIGNEVIVSNFGFAMAGLFLNDPPILNLPQNNITSVAYEPQNILFQWTPRHRGSPNSAFSAEYVFRLYEVWNENTDPNLIASTQMPIFEAVSASPRYPFGIAEPMLVMGKKYVWQVQVREPESRDLFRNNGFSEAYIFQYGEECRIPANFDGHTVNGPGIELQWESATGHTDYLLQYRVKGSSNWYEESSLLDNIRIYDLLYENIYEVRVQAQCGTFQSEYSQVLTLETDEEPLQDFDCGAETITEEITNHDPLEFLNAGDMFTAGGFNCKVTKASGGDGTFSGECLVTIPFFLYAKVQHTFENIKINTDRVMWSGKLVAVKDSAKDAAFMNAIQDQEWPAAPEYSNEYVALVFNAMDIITTNSPIQSIEVSDDGDITITHEDGSKEEVNYPGQLPVIVADNQGNQYLVDEDGVATKVTPEMVAAAEAERGAATAQVVDNIQDAIDNLPTLYFAPAEDSKFGYDSLRYDAMRNQYKEATILEETYIIPYKAVATGDIDFVKALIPESDDLSSEAFSFKAGEMPVTGTAIGASAQQKLSLTALTAGEEIPLEAYYSLQDTAGNTHDELLGKVTLATYDKAIHKAYIVPVQINGQTPSFDENSIRTYLNEVYGQAAVEWTVTTMSPLQVDASEVLDEDNKFVTDDADNWADYTRAMKTIYKANNDRQDRDRDAVYVFLIANPTTDSDLGGYMLFHKPYAFIFTSNISSSESKEHVIAHELGHGAFSLRHTFSSGNDYTLGQNTTTNVMDYAGAEANHLFKYQWDLIHDPQTMLFAFLQDEEEGAYYDATITDIWNQNVNNIACANFNKQTQVEIEGVWPELKGAFTFGDFGKVGLEIPEIAAGQNDKLIDLTSLKTTEKTNYDDGSKYIEVVYKSVSGKYRVFFDIPIEKKTEFLDIINSSDEAYFETLINNIPEEESNEAYSKLSQLPICSYEKIGITDRIKYWEWLSGEKWTNDDQEVLIINLLRYANNRKEIYDALYKRPLLLANMLISCDTENRNIFLDEITKLCEENWPTERIPKGTLYTGKVPQNYGTKRLYSGYDFIVWTHVRENQTDCGVNNYIGRFPMGFLEWGNVQVLKEFEGFKCNLLDPVEVFDKDGKGDGAILPLIYPTNTSQQRGNQALMEQFAATLNYIGVSSSVKLLATGTKYTKLLALTELAKTGVDLIFDDPQVIEALNQTEESKKFLKYWQIASITIDIATVGADVLQGIAENGAKASRIADNAGKTDAADNIYATTHEAEKALGMVPNLTVDWQLVRRYFTHIQEVTGRAVPANQIDEIKKALKAKEYKLLSKTELDAHRIDFNKKKNQLISEWESKTGQTWPVLEEDIYDETGKLIAKKGRKYDAHHIIENKYGGNNEWWNIHPAKFPDEHQAGIHGAGSPSRELFK